MSDVLAVSPNILALLNSQQKEIIILRYVLDNIAARVFWKDKDGKFLGANTACLNDMGVLSRDDIVGKTDYDLFPKEQARNFQKDDRDVMENGSKNGIEEPQEQADGTHWLLTHKTQLKDGDDVIGVLGVYVDITQRKNLELKNKEQEEQLVHNSKMAAVGTLIAGLGHELNNPLAALILHVDYLLALPRLHEDTQLMRAFLTMQTQIHRGMSIVAALLNFSRKEALVKEVLTVDSFFRHVARFADPMSIQYEAKLVFDRGIVSLKLLACRQEIETVLLNLITNALQSLDKTRPNNEVSIRAINKTLNGKYGIEISVTDTGSGIRATDLPRIFEPFFTTKSPGEGTGLGLSLARKIIDDHGGEIRVESKEGKGTAIRFWLPGVG